ncbi:MAG: DUF2203 family protein [Thermoplasmatota archaeon]
MAEKRTESRRAADSGSLMSSPPKSHAAEHASEPKTFTVEEANGLLPLVGSKIPKLREAFHAWQFARDQIADLESMWQREGVAGLADPNNPDRPEYERLLAHAARSEREARTLLDELLALGVEVKDPTLGLVDFPARGRDGNLVLLCWREGEDSILAWHPMSTGFAGRRPVAEL